MASLDTIERRLSKIEKQNSEILKLLNPNPDKIHWVRQGMVMTATGLSRATVRTMRENNPALAKTNGVGRFLYDLSAFKKIAS